MWYIQKTVQPLAYLFISLQTNSLQAFNIFSHLDNNQIHSLSFIVASLEKCLEASDIESWGL